MKRIVRFTLNNKKFGSQITIEGVHQGDENSCDLIISVSDGNKILDMSSATTVATMNGTKPDGTLISRPCSIVDNNIVYTLNRQDTAVSGNVLYQVTISTDDGTSQSIISTAKFTVSVMKNIYVPIYRMLEEEPPDWSENFKSYYRLIDNKYIAITDEICPVFEMDMFYCLINPNYDSKDDYTAFHSALARLENLFGRASEINEDLNYLDTSLNKKVEYEATKNLLIIPNIQSEQNGIVVCSDNNHILIQGTATANSTIIIPISFQANGKYTFSIQNITDIKKNAAINLRSSGSIVCNLSTMAMTNSYNFESTELIDSLVVWVGNGTTINKECDIQLESGQSCTEYVKPLAIPNTYSTGQVDSLLSEKADKDSVLTENEIDERYCKSKVYVDLSAFTSGKYINYTNGNLGNVTNGYVSDFIPINVYLKYKLSITSSPATDYRGVAFYNSSKGYISGMQYIKDVLDYEITPPDGASYIRISVSGEASGFNLSLISAVPDIVDYLNNRIDGSLPTDDLPLANMISDAGFASIFKSFNCIGDSLTQGVFERTNGTPQDFYATDYCNYPQQLKRITGATVYNRGNAGATAMNSEQSITDKHSWLNTASSKNWISESDKSSAYIIALGTNDIGYYGSFTGDASTDIDTENYNNNNTTTSVGGYATIIQKILEIQPKAKIFCVTLPNILNSTANRKSANEKIRSIATLFGCYVLDMEKYWFPESDKESWKSNYFNNGHCNPMGYRMFAKAVVTYIDWLVSHNYRDFSNVQFIGTDMEFN